MKRSFSHETVASVGEDALIARWTEGLAHMRGNSAAPLLVGPGDDCAVVGRRRDARWTLLKTDAVVEGIHFLGVGEVQADAGYFARVGWKALARAVSDIAAMGGEPLHALVTVGLPRTFPLACADALYAGLRRCASAFRVAIAGGETTRSPGPAFLSVALTGGVERRRCVLRSGGKPGDALYVTGRLGGSIAGKHLDFTPRLREARWLTERFPLHAMMDVSDGLASDLPRLARASRCGFQLGGPGVGDLPITPGSTRHAALTDGEDFELLFALHPRHAARLEKTWPFRALALTRIGQFVANREVQNFGDNEELSTPKSTAKIFQKFPQATSKTASPKTSHPSHPPRPPQPHGYDHFA